MFMGTPNFGVPTLEKLVQSKHKITLIVTMPDKPKGRDLKVVFSPVKAFALEHNIEVFQPENLKDPQVIEQIKASDLDAALICAYGKIIPGWLLEYPKYGCINIHPSLLPLYRGPSPIETAVLNGDKVTGTTIMKVTEELDSGAILLQNKIEILESDTSGTIAGKLSLASADLTLKAIDMLEAGSLTATEQEHAKATYTRKFLSADGLIDWTRPSHEINCRIRAFNPKPGAFSFINGKRIKLLKARAVNLDVGAIYSAKITDHGANSAFLPGSVLSADAENGLIIATGDGQIQAIDVQLEGKKVMTAQELLRGHNILPGDKLLTNLA